MAILLERLEPLGGPDVEPGDGEEPDRDGDEQEILHAPGLRMIHACPAEAPLRGSTVGQIASRTARRRGAAAKRKPPAARTWNCPWNAARDRSAVAGTPYAW